MALETRGPHYELCATAALPSDDMEMRESSVWPLSDHRVGITGVGHRELPDADGRIVPRASALFVLMAPIGAEPRVKTEQEQMAENNAVVEGSVIAIGTDRYCVLGIAPRRRNENGTVWLRKLAANVGAIPTTLGDACRNATTSPDDVTLQSRSRTAPCIARHRIEVDAVSDDRYTGGSTGPTPDWVAALLLFDPATNVGQQAIARKGDVLPIGDARYSVIDVIAGNPGRIRLHKLAPPPPAAP